MKTKWLFPHRFRLIGWIIFVPSVALGLLSMYANFEISWLKANWLNESMTITSGNSATHLLDNQDLTDEVAAIGVILGLLFIAF